MDPRIEKLAKMMEDQQILHLSLHNLDCPGNRSNCKTQILDGKKYTKIDAGNSGKLMIEKNTGEIYGIKGYGVIHKGHHFGNLDTINDWNWGGYFPSKKV